MARSCNAAPARSSAKALTKGAFAGQACAAPISRDPPKLSRLAITAIFCAAACGAEDFTTPTNNQVRDAMADGARLDSENLYGVVSNNHVRDCGDGYTMFRDARDADDFGPDLADAAAEYLAAQGPYTPYTDGRITVGLK